MSGETHRFQHPAIVCRCMDVTAEEMVQAFNVMVKYLGTVDADTYRRISGAVTGFCQGRGCLQHLQRTLANEARKAGINLNPDLLLPKRRPPLQPVPLGLFADPKVLEEALEEVVSK